MNSAGGNATNASKNLLNQAQGFAGPGSPLYQGFESSLGTATGRQSDLYNASFEALQGDLTTGGYDPKTLNALLSGYGDLATTGGFTPAQSQAFVRQATEGTQATYGTLEDQAKRARIATGGLGTGGALSQMARQLGQVQGTNTLNANVALNELQTSNKLAGLGGEANVAGSVAGNRLAANEMINQLYNTTTGQVSDLGNKLLKTLGLDFATQGEAINALTQLSRNPGLFQTILGDLISAGGAAAGAAGALGVLA